MSYRKENGLPRRFAPRNDMQKHASVRMARTLSEWQIRCAFRIPQASPPLQPRTPTRLQHVIANQCAHWCGNPRLRRETGQVGCCLGKFVTLSVFAQRIAFRFVLPQENGLPRRFAPRNDSGGGAIAPHVLATADTWQISACHCEPVRTLVRQSASPQRNLARW